MAPIAPEQLVRQMGNQLNTTNWKQRPEWDWFVDQNLNKVDPKEGMYTKITCRNKQIESHTKF